MLQQMSDNSNEGNHETLEMGVTWHDLVALNLSLGHDAGSKAFDLRLQILSVGLEQDMNREMTKCEWQIHLKTLNIIIHNDK